MTLAKAEATTVLVARETTLGTAPTTAWRQLQPNAGGLQEWNATFTDVRRDPLSKFASHEKGDHVGLDAAPKIVHDLNKELVDEFAEGCFRSVAKHGGNTGQSLFRPTAVTATGYTVAALGGLTNNFLIFARGFTTAANNGLKVAAGTSTGTEIKTTGLVAEAAPPANATVEVAGWRGASADIAMDVNGNLTSVAGVFLGWGLVAGVSWVKLGGALTANRFATAAYNGRAKVKTVTATLITFERRSWTVGAADAGAAKLIDVYFTRSYRNVAIDHADYLEPSWHGEKEDIGVGTANASVFTYAKGLSVKTLELDMPIESKIVATMSLIGTDVTDPVLAAARIAGASTGYLPLASSLLDTSTDLLRARLAVADTDVQLSAEINSCKLTIENNIKPRKQLGTYGAAGMIFGKFEASASMEIYYLTDEIPKAIRDNRSCWFDVAVRNEQVGFIFDLPAVVMRGGGMSYAANDPVMVSLDVPAHRDSLTNVVACLSVFAYLPD